MSENQNRRKNAYQILIIIKLIIFLCFVGHFFYFFVNGPWQRTNWDNGVLSAPTFMKEYNIPNYIRRNEFRIILTSLFIMTIGLFTTYFKYRNKWLLTVTFIFALLYILFSIDCIVFPPYVHVNLG